jgi:nucleoid-associated protein YejK
MTPEMIKKNAKIAFDLYCKNQMELGGNKTFDRLSEEASTMTIGKLLVYAKAYNMTSLIINKDILMRKFKKISEGKRAINF